MGLRRVHPECMDDFMTELQRLAKHKIGNTYEERYDLALLNIRRKHLRVTLAFVKEMVFTND